MPLSTIFQLYCGSLIKPKLYMNLKDYWIASYKVGILNLDLKFKMSATARQSFTIGHYGKMTTLYFSNELLS
jgi:hypothetical protein